MRKIIVFIIIFFFIGAGVIPSISGSNTDINIPIYSKTIFVDDDFIDDPPNHRWNTIAKGLNDSDDGDLIRVYDGYYTEILEVDKSVKIEGNGSHCTTIDGNYIGTILNITKNGVTISGFELKNSGDKGDQMKAIEVWHSNNIQIYENNFTNNVMDLVISFCEGYQGTIDVYNNNFTEGRSTNWGVVPCMSIGKIKEEDFLIRNNRFFNKKIGSYLLDSNGLTISENHFENCDVARRFINGNSNEIIGNEIILTSQDGIAGILLVENSGDNRILYNYINSTEDYKYDVGLEIQGFCNTNTIKYNNFYINKIALRSQFSFFNIITWNNFWDSSSGWDLWSVLSVNCYWWNFWNQDKGPFGRVFSPGALLFCIPWSPWPWQNWDHWPPWEEDKNN